MVLVKLFSIILLSNVCAFSSAYFMGTDLDVAYWIAAFAILVALEA